MTHQFHVHLLVAAAALSFSTMSFAQEGGDSAGATAEGSDDAPKSKMNLSVAPPPAPLQRTAYVHEGFYFRLGAGPGFLSTRVTDTNADVSASNTSFSLGSDLLVGGSPSPGMTIGGGGLLDLGFATDPSLAFLAGPFFDAHPYNKGGWHVGGMLGFAGMTLGGNAPASTLLGGGGSFWGGHDIWVAPEWSVGLGTRLTASRVLAADANATNFSLHFLITILNH